MKNIIIFIAAALLFLSTAWSQQTDHFIIENIIIEGNGKTRDYVIFENLPFQSGDSITENQIQEGISNLQQLNLFKNVTLQPRPGSETGNLDLTILVEERYWPSLRFKGGFSELSGWYLTPLSLNLDNLLGYGNFISTNLTFGDRITHLNFDFVNPDFLNTGMDYYFSMNLKNSQYINYIDGKQYIQQVPQGGYFMGMKSRTGLFSKFLFGWEIYTTKPDSFFTENSTNDKYFDIPAALSQYSTEGLLSSVFSIYCDLDTRDQYFFPTRGWWMGLWLARADTKLGSQVDFSRMVFDLRKYVSLNKYLALAGRVKLGSITADAPFYEKFYLGGPNSLRGFQDRILSPQGGGDRLYQAGVEMRFPIATKNFPKHFLTGVIFYDTGAALPAHQILEKEDLHSSYGFGFRFKLPFVSLLRMDFAYPLNSDSEESRIYFSIGHTF